MNDILKKYCKALETATITSTNGANKEYACDIEGTEARVLNEIVWDSNYDGTGRYRAILRVIIGDGVVFTWGAVDSEDTAFIVSHMQKQYMKFFKDEVTIKNNNSLLFNTFVSKNSK